MRRRYGEGVQHAARGTLSARNRHTSVTVPGTGTWPFGPRPPRRDQPRRRRLAPLLRGDREQPVVLPHARDPQVAEREPLLAEAELLEDADRRDVPRDHRSL